MTKPNSDWFYWREARPGVWLIAEPGHVYTWLVVGSQGACLIDTGLGIEPIRPVVEAITSLPITVVNTHFHFDHVGGNWEFEHLLVHPEARSQVGRPLPVETIDGYTGFVRAREASLEAFRTTDASFFGFLTDATNPRPLPADFRERFGLHRPLDAAVDGVEDGQLIDLGDRCLTVMHTPGHSRDSLVLIDEREGILFAGDTFNLGLLYCHFADSSLADYRKSASRLAEVASDLQCIAAHHVPYLIAEPSQLVALAAALDLVDTAEQTPTVDVLGQACLCATVGEFTITLPDPTVPAAHV